MSITEEIKRTLRDKASAIYNLLVEKGALEDELNDPDRSDSYKQSVRRRLDTIRIQIGNMKNSVQNDCKKILDQRRTQLVAGRRLRGEDVNDDAKLFNLGIVLPVEEVEAIFDRNAGNHTMQRLCQMYANQHDLKMNQRVIQDRDTEDLNGLENTSILFVDHWIDRGNAFEMLNKFFPEEGQEKGE